MKYIDEFRDPALAQQWIVQIHRDAARRHGARPIRLMEFCGGHTHAISRFGLRELLAPAVELRSGPGCPVCVTAAADLDRAIAMADVPGVILATFGDMMRVPGSAGTLYDARGRGADVRIVYSPLDALEIARRHPQQSIVFLGVGFETTAPGMAAALLQAEADGVPNFSLLSLHKLTPPAMRAILEAGEVALDGIIGPGHVSAITGSAAWEFLPREYGIPCAVAGFEPLDILSAIGALVRAVVAGEAAVINTYARGVRPQGNLVAQQLLARAFAVAPADWRGFGVIPDSGLALRQTLAHRDAARLFPIEARPAPQPTGCRCGDVLRGVITPTDCALFRRVCSPRTPVGPCMVSTEGACAAYFQYE
ncbi:MAG TPA: hydrogenase formation protein HypD [Anaerolineae bacterium]|nr:hydrogenase formation protein HypD [Anaerolineae bacterium]HQH38783.1 hydrogenase formation protein HypD [Anaerolineae bacterium]